jgi:prepilin peptidase CpaA
MAPCTSLSNYATGFAAAALSMQSLTLHLHDAMAAGIAIFLLVICLIDTVQGRIPNPCIVGLSLFGFGYHLTVSGWPGLGMATLGFGLGLALLLLPFLMGGMGAGDVKALAALGAVLGPAAVFQVFLYAALFGGVLCLLHLLTFAPLRRTAGAASGSIGAFLFTRDPRQLLPSGAVRKRKLPYAAALALGYYAFQHWGSLI